MCIRDRTKTRNDGTKYVEMNAFFSKMHELYGMREKDLAHLLTPVPLQEPTGYMATKTPMSVPEPAESTVNGILDDTALGSKKMPQTISEGQVRSLFYLWNDALATGDSRIVAKRYSSDAMLLPTVSDVP